MPFADIRSSRYIRIHGGHDKTYVFIPLIAWRRRWIDACAGEPGVIARAPSTLMEATLMEATLMEATLMEATPIGKSVRRSHKKSGIWGRVWPEGLVWKGTGKEPERKTAGRIARPCRCLRLPESSGRRRLL